MAGQYLQVEITVSTVDAPFGKVNVHNYLQLCLNLLVGLCYLLKNSTSHTCTLVQKARTITITEPIFVRKSGCGLSFAD
jgi:hypothetical protein